MLGIQVAKYVNRQQKRKAAKELSHAIRVFEEIEINFLQGIFLEGKYFYWYNGKYSEKKPNTYNNVYEIYSRIWASAITHLETKCKYITFSPEYFKEAYQPLETPIKK